MTTRRTPPTDRESGQAMVEAALTMPLSLFLILGTLQLFMLQQGRIMAQYAVARAARAGSLNSGRCEVMNQAAIASLLPAIHPFLTPGGSAADKYWTALQPLLRNKYIPGPGFPHDEKIVWIFREGTTFNDISASPVDDPSTPQYGTEDAFDLPYDPGGFPVPKPLLLELRMVFWYPLQIPFANYVMSRMAQARYGIQPYNEADPLMLRHARAGWVADPQAVLRQDVKDTLAALLAGGKYAFPIEVTYVTRMMTPPRLDAPYSANDCHLP